MGLFIRECELWITKEKRDIGCMLDRKHSSPILVKGTNKSQFVGNRENLVSQFVLCSD